MIAHWLLLGLPVVAGCVDLGTTPPPAPEPPDADPADATEGDAPRNRVKVVLSALRFAPQALEIPRGTVVEWTNRDAVPHTVTEGTPEGGGTRLFDSPLLATGDVFRFTFREAGSWVYFCRTHANVMRDARVVVR